MVWVRANVSEDYEVEELGIARVAMSRLRQHRRKIARSTIERFLAHEQFPCGYAALLERWTKASGVLSTNYHMGHAPVRWRGTGARFFALELDRLGYTVSGSVTRTRKATGILWDGKMQYLTTVDDKRIISAPQHT